jgi:hypothetical protein
LKFVIGGALTILSWDNPITAFFRKSKKLRHSLGRPSRSDFVHFQLCAQLRVCSQAGGIPVYPRFSQPDNSESWDDAGNGI